MEGGVALEKGQEVWILSLTDEEGGSFGGRGRGLKVTEDRR